MQGQNFGDYINTGDRAANFRPSSSLGEAVPTTNESYGYNKFDHTHKSPAHFIRLLASAAAKNGNILLKIGSMEKAFMVLREILFPCNRGEKN